MGDTDQPARRADKPAREEPGARERAVYVAALEAVVLAALAFAPQLARFGPTIDGWRLSCRLVLVIIACALGIALAAFALSAEGSWPGAHAVGNATMAITPFVPVIFGLIALTSLSYRVDAWFGFPAALLWLGAIRSMIVYSVLFYQLLRRGDDAFT